jgi:hypothetical protein
MRVTRNPNAHAVDLRPPCWVDGQKQNPCAVAHYDHVVNGHVDLRADWLGWKQRGKWLVSPQGDRISPERMKGILWRLQAEDRLAIAKARNAQGKAVRHQPVKVVVIDLADWHTRNVGTMAG